VNDPVRYGWIAAKSRICAPVAFLDVPASLTANSSAAITAGTAASAEILVSATAHLQLRRC
jgi:hypothetical protein